MFCLELEDSWAVGDTHTRRPAGQAPTSHCTLHPCPLFPLVGGRVSRAGPRSCLCAGAEGSEAGEQAGQQRLSPRQTAARRRPATGSGDVAKNEEVSHCGSRPHRDGGGRTGDRERAGRGHAGWALRGTCRWLSGQAFDCKPVLRGWSHVLMRRSRGTCQELVVKKQPSLPLLPLRCEPRWNLRWLLGNAK